MARSKHPGSEFLEEILPRAVASSMAKRMASKRQSAQHVGPTEGEHDDPMSKEAGPSEHGPRQHGDENDFSAPADLHEEPGLNAEEDASKKPRQMIPSESRDRAAAARLHARMTSMGGSLDEHPSMPEDNSHAHSGSFRGAEQTSGLEPETGHQSSDDPKKNRFPPKSWAHGKAPGR